MDKAVNVFWFRRDLRLNDNAGLYHALMGKLSVLPLFIFDTTITDKLETNDSRVSFIYERLNVLDEQLRKYGSRMLVLKGNPTKVLEQVITDYPVQSVYTNHDYEPDSIRRDQQVEALLRQNGIGFESFKDHVIFEKSEVVKSDGNPYTVYTPYMRSWMKRYQMEPQRPFSSEEKLNNFAKLGDASFPEITALGFVRSQITVPPFDVDDALIANYKNRRDFPSQEGTSRIGPYLRFGIVGIRSLVQKVKNQEATFWKELVWREFFIQILHHFPQVVDRSFRLKYDRIEWQNDEEQFRRWSEGKTGYPLVDAGMRELKQTGYMHNRVRMVVASFLCKHLLVDWRWGEAWFAKHLLDYELASNNGNWQWAAGSGCDAAPYFRVFNPETQLKKFDPDLQYVRSWIPEFGSNDYPQPMVDHKFARERALRVYREALQG